MQILGCQCIGLHSDAMDFTDLVPHKDAVRAAGSARQLADAIAHLARATQPWGLWQDPDKLAACLWEVRRLARHCNFTTFLEIGTSWGYSFFASSAFLDGMVGLTIDDMNRVITEVAPHLRRCRAIAPLTLFANRAFDVVFFDCRKPLRKLRADYTEVGAKAKVCVFAEAGPEVQAWWGTLGREVVDLGGAGLLLNKV